MTILNDPVNAKLGDRAQLSYIEEGYVGGDEKKYAKYIMELVSE